MLNILVFILRGESAGVESVGVESAGVELAGVESPKHQKFTESSV